MNAKAKGVVCALGGMLAAYISTLLVSLSTGGKALLAGVVAGLAVFALHKVLPAARLDARVR